MQPSPHAAVDETLGMIHENDEISGINGDKNNIGADPDQGRVLHIVLHGVEVQYVGRGRDSLTKTITGLNTIGPHLWKQETQDPTIPIHRLVQGRLKRNVLTIPCHLSHDHWKSVVRIYFSPRLFFTIHCAMTHLPLHHYKSAFLL